jgi:hypothetical protein
MENQKTILRLSSLLLSFCLLPSLSTEAQNTAKKKDKTAISSGNTAYFNGLKWRNIGPFRAGRSLAVAGHAQCH